MAKQTQVLNRFDGGINDQFSQQDIPDNTLVKADNVMVDKPGRIRLVGSQQDAGLGEVPGVTAPGYGMFVFQSDFDNVLPYVEKSLNSTAALTTGFLSDDAGAALDYSHNSVDDLTPNADGGAWEDGQTHVNVEQTGTTGSGTGLKCKIVTSGGGNTLTFTITAGGTGYVVDEEITFTDPHAGTTNTAVLIIATHTGTNVYLYDNNGTDGVAGGTSPNISSLRWVLQKDNGVNSDNNDGWFSYDSGYIVGDTSGGNRSRTAYVVKVEPGKCYKVSYQVNILADTSTVRAWCHAGINLVTGTDIGTPQTTDGYYTEYFEVKSNSNGAIGVTLLNGSADGGVRLTYFSLMEVPSMRNSSYIAFQNQNATYLRDTTNNIWRKEALGQPSGTQTHGVINIDDTNFPTTSFRSKDTQPIFYIADGILRLSDANFSNSNHISKWYGILNKTFFADTTGNAIWRTWYAGDQKLYKPTGTSHISSAAEACDTAIRDATVTLDDVFGDVIYVGSYVSGTGVFPDTVVASINTGTEGSNVSSFELSKKAFANGDEIALTFARKLNYHPGKATSAQEDSASTSAYPDLNNEGLSTDGLKFVFGDDQLVASATNGTWTGTFKFYVSYLYDKSKQESGLLALGSTTNTASDVALACAVSVKYYDTTKNVYLFNERVTGARIYYSDADDADGLYYQLLEIDFEKGVKKYDELNYTDWAVTTAGSIVECPEDSLTDTTTQATSFHFLHPPKVLTYQSLNGYDSDEETIFKYKTAVIANRRCYIGNVARLDTSGVANNIIEKFNDRIIKSPVNKFDTFPEGNFLDVTVNDGDEIVRLETFADRLLQFKKNKMFIINISQDVEFLESEHNFMGIDHYSAVTKTEIGVVWTNPRGCYIYDGKQIKNLIDSKINVNTWKDFLTVSGMVGYIPDKKQIIVVKDPGQADGSCYIYDFTTTSWTFGNSLLSYVMKTNMTNDKFGNLIWGEYVNESSSSVYAGLVSPGYSNNAQEGSIGVTPTASLAFNCPEQFGDSVPSKTGVSGSGA